MFQHLQHRLHSHQENASALLAPTPPTRAHDRDHNAPHPTNPSIAFIDCWWWRKGWVCQPPLNSRGRRNRLTCRPRRSSSLHLRVQARRARFTVNLSGEAARNMGETAGACYYQMLLASTLLANLDAARNIGSNLATIVREEFGPDP